MTITQKKKILPFVTIPPGFTKPQEYIYGEMAPYSKPTATEGNTVNVHV